MFLRIPNLRNHDFFSRICSCFLLKEGRIFLLRSKMLLKLFILTKKDTLAPLKENKTFLKKKTWIRRFGIHGNMSRGSD